MRSSDRLLMPEVCGRNPRMPMPESAPVTRDGDARPDDRTVTFVDDDAGHNRLLRVRELSGETERGENEQEPRPTTHDPPIRQRHSASAGNAADEPWRQGCAGRERRRPRFPCALSVVAESQPQRTPG